MSVYLVLISRQDYMTRHRRCCFIHIRQIRIVLREMHTHVRQLKAYTLKPRERERAIERHLPNRYSLLSRTHTQTHTNTSQLSTTESISCWIVGISLFYFWLTIASVSAATLSHRRKKGAEVAGGKGRENTKSEAGSKRICD